MKNNIDEQPEKLLQAHISLDVYVALKNYVMRTGVSKKFVVEDAVKLYLESRK